MSFEFLALILLGTLLIAQNAFWGYLCLKLAKKIMAKDYSDYVQGEKLLKQKPKTKAPIAPDDAAFDPESERHAKELNALFNIV